MRTAGPLVMDLLGLDITAEEYDMLAHPLVGGVILFSRNSASPSQLADLCRLIRQARKKQPILIGVDQEGGRVQRFKTGFLSLPPMREIGELYTTSISQALDFAQCVGWLMAAELLAVGVDFSFAPVLDLDKNLNTVIGDRAFGRDPEKVAQLAKSFCIGMRAAGMASVGKHFPGHGSVTVDSHIGFPLDNRSLAHVQADDLQPFAKLIAAGITAIMPAHIVFTEIDPLPVGFSRFWLQEVLRKQLQFTGMIFSDCLGMQAASVAGDYAARAQAALEAGCDMVLMCNERDGAIQILDRLPQHYTVSAEKIASMQGAFSHGWPALHQSSAWKNHYHSFVHYRKIYANYE